MTEKQKKFLVHLVEEIGTARFVEIVEEMGVDVSSLISRCAAEREELLELKERLRNHPRFKELYDWRILLYADREFCELLMKELENAKSVEEELKEAFDEA